MNKTNIVFLGTPNIACPTLLSLINDDRFTIKGVITQPDKPTGRKQIITPSPIKIMASEHSIPVFQPEKLNKDLDLISMMKNWNIDFLVVIAYGQIVSQAVLDLPKVCPINVHFSILPKYRGASPIEHTLLNGDLETGVSIMKMGLKMDEGPIFTLYKQQISSQDNKESLFTKMALLSAEVIGDLLLKIKNGEIKPIEQNHADASYCKKLFKQDAEINPYVETAHNILCKIKAFPNEAFIKINGKSCKVIEAVISKQDINIDAGSFSIDSSKLFLGTKDGILLIEKVQLEGKKAMNTRDFLCGNSKIFNN